MRQIGRNMLSLGLSRITSGLLLFFVFTRLAAYLGPSDFGKFSLILAYYTIFLLFVDLGISRYVIKRISEDKSQAPVYLGNFFVAQLVLAILVSILFVFIPKWFGYEPEVSRAMFYTGLGLLLAALSIPFAAIVQAWQRIHLLALVYFLDSLIRAVWLILAILWQKDLVFIFSVYILTGVLDIFLYSLLTHKIVRPSFVLDRKLVRQLFWFGVPFAFISGFEILIAKVDVVIQKFFLPFTQVGYYSAAYRFLDFLTFVPAVVAISLFPVLSELPDLRTAEVRAVLDRYNRYMVVLAVPLGVAITLFADKIIFVLFGPDYGNAVLLFRILIWATVVTFLYAVPNVLMQVKKTRTAVWILAFAALFNAALNVLLVPRYGIVASAWLTVATYLLVAGSYVYYSKQIAVYSFAPYIFWPVFASAVMGGGLWLVRDFNIFLITGLAFGIYFAVLRLSGFLSQDDWRFLRSLASK